MSEHTKEPWRVMGSCAQWEMARIFSGARYIGSIGNSDETESETRANADRIVSCVNACAGMEDPELEIGEIQTKLQEALAAIENQKDFISALKAQRDELLAAARIASDVLKQERDHTPMTFRFISPSGAIKRLDTAIANAEAAPCD